MSRLPNLLWLKSFETTARQGGFTAAAKELGLTQAAVSTHIRSLESQLGHSLFDRSTRKVALTEIGKAYLPSVRKALEDLALSTEGLFGGQNRESVIIRAPISTAVLVLAPELPRFQTKHPAIDIRLLSSIWAETALETHIDVDIRQGDGRWRDGPASPLAQDHVVPICAPCMAERIDTPEALRAVPLIQILGYEDHWLRYFEQLGAVRPDTPPVITVDTTLAAVELSSTGGGVALVLERAARRLEASGRIAIPLPHRIPMVQTLFLVENSPARRPRAAVETVRDWIKTVLG